MSETKIAEGSLIDEIEAGKFGIADLLNMDVQLDVGYGDFVPCRIVDIVSIPVLNDPDCPDNGYHETYHLVLQAYEAKLNTNQYNSSMMVYRIYPLETDIIFRSIEDNPGTFMDDFADDDK